MHWNINVFIKYAYLICHYILAKVIHYNKKLIFKKEYKIDLYIIILKSKTQPMDNGQEKRLSLHCLPQNAVKIISIAFMNKKRR